MPLYFICIAVALVLVYVPRWAATLPLARMPGGYDNHHPRDQHAQAKGWVRRALAAHTNGFENFPGFAVGVIVAHLGRMAPEHITILAIVFCASRLLHSIAYIADWAPVRSVLWGIGFAATLTLLLGPLVWR